jgi:hypothetical protein
MSARAAIGALDPSLAGRPALRGFKRPLPAERPAFGGLQKTNGPKIYYVADQFGSGSWRSAHGNKYTILNIQL